MKLDARELDFWEACGYLVRESQFTADELIVLRDAVECAAKHAAECTAQGDTYILDGKRFVDVDQVTIQFEHEPDSETVRVVEPIHQYDSRIDHLLDDSRITLPMTQLVGTAALSIWTNKLNLKRPREGSGFGWHQDSPYWMHDCNHVDQLPNVMVTLDDADQDNGCFRGISGSHKRGILGGTDDGSQLGGFYTSPDAFDSSAEVLFEVPAGSLIFFNPHLVHGSGPNRADRPRRALILTYQPANHPMLKNGRVRNVVL